MELGLSNNGLLSVKQNGRFELDLLWFIKNKEPLMNYAYSEKKTC